MIKIKKTIASISIICTFFFSSGFAQTSCVNCHQQLDDELKIPAELIETDIHSKFGYSCHTCHGGDPNPDYEDDMEAAMDPAKGYIGIPSRQKLLQICSDCHSNSEFMRQYNPGLPTDQYAQYLTSQHGKLLKNGDSKVAVCSDCHGIHHIQPANMTSSKVFPNNIAATCGSCHADQEYMADYSIPTDQVELYNASVHGINLIEKGDRSSPTCNTCHGNHGAFPPGISSISHVCGTCHITQAEMFRQSPHFEAFREMDLPQCETCHGNHEVQSTSMDMLGVGPNSLCIDCHDDDSRAYLSAKKMKNFQDSLFSDIEQAKIRLKKAENAGVEVSDGFYLIKDANNVLIKSRNSVHYFLIDKFIAVIEPGFEIANNALSTSESALKEVQNRRLALAVISVIIFIAAISLYFKSKLIEKKL